jgi:hypothetical protein
MLAAPESNAFRAAGGSCAQRRCARTVVLVLAASARHRHRYYSDSTRCGRRRPIAAGVARRPPAYSASSRAARGFCRVRSDTENFPFAGWLPQGACRPENCVARQLVPTLVSVSIASFVLYGLHPQIRKRSRCTEPTRMYLHAMAGYTLAQNPRAPSLVELADPPVRPQPTVRAIIYDYIHNPWVDICAKWRP